MKLCLHQENESTFGLNLLTFNDLPQGKTNEPILHYKEKRGGKGIQPFSFHTAHI